MGRTYKWLGGIGYILMLIPYANFIGAILAAIAWIMMGSDTRQGIFKARRKGNLRRTVELLLRLGIRTLLCALTRPARTINWFISRLFLF